MLRRKYVINRMTVAGLVKTSLVDFPGKIACVIFLPRCNFDCFYCHNRHILTGADETFSKDELDAFLEKRKRQLDGVVVTGGEPTLYPDLPEFLRHIKSFGYQVKLDTNGTNVEVVRKIIGEGICDYFAVDYKAPKDEYEEFAGHGADANTVLETINLLLESGVLFEVRTTIAPGIDEKKLVKMAQELPKLPRYSLNIYRKPEHYPKEYESKVDAYALSSEQIRAAAKLMQQYQPNVIAH